MAAPAQHKRGRARASGAKSQVRRGRAHGTAVVVALTLTPVAMWPWGSDVLGLPKALLLLGAAWCIVAALTRAVLQAGAVTLPANPVAAAMAVFGLVVLVRAGAAAPSVAGWIGGERFNGPAMLVAAVVMGLSVQTSWRTTAAMRSLRWFAVSIGLVAAYASLQSLGLDPIVWATSVTGVSSTLGNPNYLAAFLAIGLPLVLTVAVLGGRLRLRAVAWGVLVCGGWAVFASRSDQGWAAGGLGLLVFALVWARGLSRRRRLAIWSAGSIALPAGLVMLVLGLGWRAGPLAWLGGFNTIGFRAWSWQTALAIVAEHPLTGVGPGRYAAAFARARRPSSFNEHFSQDAAHSVPLDHLVNGGMLQGAAYAAIVLVTLWAVVRLVRRPPEGLPIPLLAGLVGAWVAYHVQSLVSIDVPPMPVLHLSISGALAALSWPRRVTLPVTLPVRGRAARRAPAMVMTVMLAVGVVPLGRLFLADASAAMAEDAMNRGLPQEALPHIRQAAALAPWSAEYASAWGQVLFAGGKMDETQRLFQRLRVRFDDDPMFLADGGRAAFQASPGRALVWYRQALRLEPVMGRLWLEAGCAARAAQLDSAEGYIRRAVRLYGRAGLPACSSVASG